MTISRVELTEGSNSSVDVQIQRRDDVALTICNNDDATQPCTLEMYEWVQIYYIEGKINHLMYVGTCLPKTKKELKTPYMCYENIRPRYRNGIWR